MSFFGFQIVVVPSGDARLRLNSIASARYYMTLPQYQELKRVTDQRIAEDERSRSSTRS